jgi:hypothetical protein
MSTQSYHSRRHSNTSGYYLHSGFIRHIPWDRKYTRKRTLFYFFFICDRVTRARHFCNACVYFYFIDLVDFDYIFRPFRVSAVVVMCAPFRTLSVALEYTSCTIMHYYELIYAIVYYYVLLYTITHSYTLMCLILVSLHHYVITLLHHYIIH